MRTQIYATPEEEQEAMRESIEEVKACRSSGDLQALIDKHIVTTEDQDRMRAKLIQGCRDMRELAEHIQQHCESVINLANSLDAVETLREQVAAIEELGFPDKPKTKKD